MMIRVLDGTGILSGVHDGDEIERRSEEERKKELVAAELEAAAAAREAEQSATRDKIEATLVEFLRDEIAEELKDQKRKRTGLDKRSRADFLRFKAHCAKFDLPHLPASPQIVAGFLTSELDKGRQHLSRCIKSISTTHRRADLADPTADLLVRALLRLAREPSQSRHTKE